MNGSRFKSGSGWIRFWLAPLQEEEEIPMETIQEVILTVEAANPQGSRRPLPARIIPNLSLWIKRKYHYTTTLS